MRTVHTVAELREQLAAWRRAGERIAFAPTMGNLHRGHLRLMEQARARAERVVASVFVNPLQFGPSEDFERYPRTLAQDQAALASVGVDLLFAPSVAEMYPRGRDGLTTIHVPGASEGLEGEFRPGHFDGVATVVNILFNLVQPDVALFGEKDYQQLTLIRAMARELALGVEVVGVPTVREDDGLALSSRNRYLSPEQRARAATLHQALRAGAAAGPQGPDTVLAAARAVLAGAPDLVQDYLELTDTDLGPAPAAGPARLLVAVRAGSTRLLDNTAVRLGGPR